MTISAQESAISANAILSSFGSDSQLTHMPPQFPAHKRPIGDDVHWNLMSHHATESHRIKYIDHVGRVICFSSEFSVENVDYNPDSTDTSVFPTLPTTSMHTVSAPPSVDLSAYASMFMGRTALLAASLNPDLYDAVHDLEEARNEAREERFPIPSDIAIGNARRLLHAMYTILPRRFEVYPTPDGEIAIDVRGRRGLAVLLLCESDGGMLCLVSMDGAHRRARYSDASMLPDGFVRDALSELEARDRAEA